MKVRRVWPFAGFGRGILPLIAVSGLIGSRPALGDNGAAGIAYPAKGIKVDGDLGDWPADARSSRSSGSSSAINPRVTRISCSSGLPSIPLSTALFVGVEVNDDSIVPDKPGQRDTAWDARMAARCFWTRTGLLMGP